MPHAVWLVLQVLLLVTGAVAFPGPNGQCTDNEQPCDGVGALQSFSGGVQFGSLSTTFTPPCPGCGDDCIPVLDYYVLASNADGSSSMSMGVQSDGDGAYYLLTVGYGNTTNSTRGTYSINNACGFCACHLTFNITAATAPAPAPAAAAAADRVVDDSAQGQVQVWTATMSCCPDSYYSSYAQTSITVTNPSPSQSAIDVAQLSLVLNDPTTCSELFYAPLTFNAVQMQTVSGAPMLNAFTPVQADENLCWESVDIDNSQQTIQISWLNDVNANAKRP